MDAYLEQDLKAIQLVYFDELVQVNSIVPLFKTSREIRRVLCQSTNWQLELEVHQTDLFQVRVNEQLRIRLVSKLSVQFPENCAEHAQLNQFSQGVDEILSGRVFEYNCQPDGKLVLSISFGGLRFKLEGSNFRPIPNLTDDSTVSLLLSKKIK